MHVVKSSFWSQWSWVHVGSQGGYVSIILYIYCIARWVNGEMCVSVCVCLQGGGLDTTSCVCMPVSLIVHPRWHHRQQEAHTPWRPKAGSQCRVCVHIHVKVCMHLTIYVCLLASEGQMGEIASLMCAWTCEITADRKWLVNTTAFRGRWWIVFTIWILCEIFNRLLRLPYVYLNTHPPIHTRTHTSTG